MFALILIASPVTAHASSPAVIDIGVPAAVGSDEPFLSAAHDRILASWLEPAGNEGQMALRLASYREGRWSEPRTIVKRDDFFVNWADFPSIIEDRKGTLFAHWLQKRGSAVYAYDVRMATSKDGGRTWSTGRLLNREGKMDEHGFVTLAPLPNGGVGAVWLDGRTMVEGKEEGDMTLRYATIDGAGAIRSEVELDNRACECCTTGMAMANGHPVVVYRDRSPEEVRDIAVVRQTANGWSKPRLLHADGWKIAGCPVNGPQIDASGSKVVVAWFSAPTEHGHVYVSFSGDAGATFGNPVAIDDGAPLGRVDVVMLDPVTAVVSWLEQTAAGAEIRARSVRRNGRLEPSVKITDSSPARAAGFARMARMGRDVFFAWTEQSGANKRIHVARSRF
jgi:hypothetical protein